MAVSAGRSIPSALDTYFCPCRLSSLGPCWRTLHPVRSHRPTAREAPLPVRSRCLPPSLMFADLKVNDPEWHRVPTSYHCSTIMIQMWSPQRLH